MSQIEVDPMIQHPLDREICKPFVSLGFIAWATWVGRLASPPVKTIWKMIQFSFEAKILFSFASWHQKMFKVVNWCGSGQSDVPSSTCCRRVESNDGRDMCTMPGPLESTLDWGRIRQHALAYGIQMESRWKRIKVCYSTHSTASAHGISGTHRQGAVHVELFPGRDMTRNDAEWWRIAAISQLLRVQRNVKEIAAPHEVNSEAETIAAAELLWSSGFPQLNPKRWSHNRDILWHSDIFQRQNELVERHGNWWNMMELECVEICWNVVPGKDMGQVAQRSNKTFGWQVSSSPRWIPHLAMGLKPQWQAKFHRSFLSNRGVMTIMTIHLWDIEHQLSGNILSMMGMMGMMGIWWAWSSEYLYERKV